MSGTRSTAEPLAPMTSGAGRVHRWTLLFARAGWLVVAALTLGVFIAAVPLRFAQLEAACAAARCVGSLSHPGAALPVALTPSNYAGLLVALDIGSALVWFAVAAIIFWRRSRDPFPLFCAYTLLLFGCARFPDTPLALAAAHPGWWLPVSLLRFSGSACLSLFCYCFPNGRFIPWWTILAAFTWIATQVPEFFVPQSALSATQLPLALTVLAFGAFVGSVVVAQGYRYWRVSQPVARQQTKWVVLGLASALTCYLVLAFALPLLVPTLHASGPAAQLGLEGATILAMLLVPVTLGIAIVRYSLFDIDQLINRALVYGSLTALLALIYTGCVIAAQAIVQVFSAQTAPPPVVVVASTLLIAALFTPLRRRLQLGIDRRFYRRRYDAARTLAAFSATLRQEVDLGELSEQLVAVVHHTMRPEHVSLWLAPDHWREVDGAGDEPSSGPGLPH